MKFAIKEIRKEDGRISVRVVRKDTDGELAFSVPEIPGETRKELIDRIASEGKVFARRKSVSLENIVNTEIDIDID